MLIIALVLSDALICCNFTNVTWFSCMPLFPLMFCKRRDECSTLCDDPSSAIIEKNFACLISLIIFDVNVI